jgi:hypothetical protein
MNAAHLHILLNHLPVVGEIFSVCLMLYGFLRKNLEVKRAALWAIVVTGICAVAANLTGGPAAKMIMGLSIVSLERIIEHARAANFALWTSALAGSLALMALLLTRDVPKLHPAPKFMNITMIASFAVALFALSTLVRTSELGGKIRHTEVNVTDAQALDSAKKMMGPPKK